MLWADRNLKELTLIWMYTFKTQGLYFDPVSSASSPLPPRTNNTAMRRALETYLELMRFNRPDAQTSCSGVEEAFRSGR